MTNPSDLLDAIVASIRDIPSLVTILGGDSSVITAYRHQWPESVDQRVALWQLKPPAILALHKATRNARWGGIPSRSHDFCLYVRAGGPGADIFTIWNSLINDMPTGGGGLAWRYADIHFNCQMVEAPELREKLLVINNEGGAQSVLEYHEITFSLIEKGDY